jgi:hypothetical protein
MADHIRIVAILHIVLGALSVLGGLAIFGVMGGLAAVIGVTGTADAVPAVPIVGGLGGLIFLVLLVLGLPGIIAGVGLLKFRPWARILGIIISALDLIQYQFGTALGIKGLWALLSRDGEMMFRDPPVHPARI